jgi:hypothetical protein
METDPRFTESTIDVPAPFSVVELGARVMVPVASCQDRIHPNPENPVPIVTVIGFVLVKRMILPLSVEDRVRAVVASVMTSGVNGALLSSFVLSAAVRIPARD